MRALLLLVVLYPALSLIFHPTLANLVHQNLKGVRLLCQQHGETGGEIQRSPAHLIEETGDDDVTQGHEDNKGVVSVCEYRDNGNESEVGIETPLLGAVYQNLSDAEAMKDAKTRLELFSLHVFGRNLTAEGSEVTYRRYNLSDEKAVMALRDLYQAERLLSLTKDFPPTKQRLEVDQDPNLTAKDKLRAKFTETMLSQHARRIALMNQREPSEEEKREVAAIDLFLSVKLQDEINNPDDGKSLRELYGYKSTDDPGVQRSLLKRLLVWFREEFPYYYSGCLQCDSKDTHIGRYIGCVYPSSDERDNRAGVCELYCCKECGAISRFPRYHSMRKVLSTRRGRCGEYSILIMRILEQLGYESRYVADWEDHVWAEVRIGNRWVHVDSCEASIDEPLLYHSWGKKQTHIYSFQPYRPRGESLSLFSTASSSTSTSTSTSSSTSAAVANRAVVEDVTRTYTPEDAWAEALARREHEGIDASCVAEAMRQAASIISQGVSD